MVVADDDLKLLEHDAKQVLGGLKKDHRPIVVEFAGSPKAGKSTSIDILTHFFKRMGYKVWAPTEGASKRTPYHLRRDLVAFNTWTLNYAISELLLAYYNVDHHNLVILDRGPYDSLAWMRLLHAPPDPMQSQLNSEELRIVNEYAVHPRWSKLISRVYLFECEPETSLKRENEHKLTRLGGTAMNPRMLEALLEQYRKLREQVAFEVLKPVQTSERTTPLGTSYELTVDVLELFRSPPG